MLQEIHGRQIYVEQAVKPRHETQNLRLPPRGGGMRGAPRGSRGGGRGGGGSRGGPRGRMGDGHMDRRLVLHTFIISDVVVFKKVMKNKMVNFQT